MANDIGWGQPYDAESGYGMAAVNGGESGYGTIVISSYSGETNVSSMDDDNKPSDGPRTIPVYSQEVDFSHTPMNSILYLCDGNYVNASWGANATNLTELIEIFNSMNAFTVYGLCYDNGDGRIRMEMWEEVYLAFECSNLTLEVIYD